MGECHSDGRCLLERTNEPTRLRWIIGYEFEHLLCCCGSEIEALYGDFDSRPFTEMEQELIWIARGT